MCNVIIMYIANLFLYSYHLELCAELPFPHQLDYNIQSSAAIHNAYKNAPAAGPVLIGIGHQLVNIRDDDVDEIKTHVSSVLPGVDARIVMEYSVLIASALLVSFSYRRSGYFHR